MPPPSALFHAFLRPPILQILRATGYHSTSPSVLDAITDMAARYLSLLCEKTAENAAHRYGDAGDFQLSDVRLALQDAGAILPEKLLTQEEWEGEEDLRGVELFVKWFSGQRMKEIMDFAQGDIETDEMDYLNALKKRHNKTSDDAKFQGTILGKTGDTGELEIEGGGELKSVNDWIRKNGGWAPSGEVQSPAHLNGIMEDDDISTPSSGPSLAGESQERIRTSRERSTVEEVTNGVIHNGAGALKESPKKTDIVTTVDKTGDDAMDLT